MVDIYYDSNDRVEYYFRYMNSEVSLFQTPRDKIKLSGLARWMASFQLVKFSY